MMRIKNYFFIVMLCFSVIVAKAQTKIGNNPAVINGGSILELEDPNKGLLLTRVQLDDATQWTLSGTPVHGMIIYNETGAEPVGLYYWNNTAPGSWLRVLNVSEKDTLGTDDQQIQTFGLNGSSLELELEDGGGLKSVDLAPVVAANETVTTLVNNGDGTYTYTDENFAVTVIDVPADIYNYGDTLLDNSQFITNLGDTLVTTQSFIDSIINIIDVNETVSSLVLNADGKNLDYTDESGVLTQIDLSVVIDNFETLTLLSLNGTALEYTDEDGVTGSIDLAPVITASETVTTLVINGDGTYTYTSEDGTTTLVDVPADIYNYGDTLLDNSQFITNLGDTLVTTQSFVDSIINIIDVNETVSSLVLNADGKNLDYTDEDGVLTQIDLSVVVDNFETVSSLTLNGTSDTLLFTDENNVVNKIALDDIVAANETVTSMTQDDLTGIITYTDESSGTSTAEVISADAGNLISAGTDGGAFMDQSAAAVGYSTTEYLTGKTWIGGEPVYEKVATITLASPSTQLDLGTAGTFPGGTASKILNLRIVDSNGGVHHSASMDLATSLVSVGMGNMYPLLPAGNYEVIIEYIK